MPISDRSSGWRFFSESWTKMPLHNSYRLRFSQFKNTKRLFHCRCCHFGWLVMWHTCLHAIAYVTSHKLYEYIYLTVHSCGPSLQLLLSYSLWKLYTSLWIPQYIKSPSSCKNNKKKAIQLLFPTISFRLAAHFQGWIRASNIQSTSTKPRLSITHPHMKCIITALTSHYVSSAQFRRSALCSGRRGSTCDVTGLS